MSKPLTVAEVRAYEGPTDAGGFVQVYDLEVRPSHRFVLASGAVVSNSKRLSLAETGALLAHGVPNILEDSGVLRGTKQDDWWTQYLAGNTPPPAKEPYTYNRFINRLRGSGINPVSEGTKTHLKALTRNDVEKMAEGRLIQSGETVQFDKDLRPVLGGLFDPSLTGGHNNQTQWGAIDLGEHFPNPAFEDPIRRILGLTGTKFDAIMAGEDTLGGYGTGPEAVHKALKGISVPKEMEITRAIIHGGRKTARDQAIKKLRALSMFDKTGIHPEEIMWNKAPVIPPGFRPVGLLGDKTPSISDSNYLYRELIDSVNLLKKSKQALGSAGVHPERNTVYQALKAVTGLGDPVSRKAQQKGIKGLLSEVFGSSGKYSTVQRQLLSFPTEGVGRGTTIPDPELEMDEIGLPEHVAFSAFGRHVARRLTRQGMAPIHALKEIEDKTPLARQALLQEMESRPVMASRAPVLHRFGIMGFRPKITAGNALRFSPIVFKPFNLDSDGDNMNIHAVTTDREVQDVLERMLPSKNLIAPADKKSPLYGLSQEYLAGLHHASAPAREAKAQVFATIKDVEAAIRRHELNYNDPVKILEEEKS